MIEIMEYYIDDRRTTKREFWNALEGIASLNQRCLILDGKVIHIGGVEYRMVQLDGGDSGISR